MDFQNSLQKNDYAYFSIVSKTSYQQVLAVISYQMYWGATLLAISVVGSCDVLALDNLKKENDVLQKRQNFYLEKNNLFKDLGEENKLLKDV